MPQEVYGYGEVVLKAGVRGDIQARLEDFLGWLEWDELQLTETTLTYAYSDIVTIGTASDLDDFLDELATNWAAEGWAHFYSDQVAFYGPDEASKLRAEIAYREREMSIANAALATARSRLENLSTV
jgi:hypothetical protein